METDHVSQAHPQLLAASYASHFLSHPYRSQAKDRFHSFAHRNPNFFTLQAMYWNIFEAKHVIQSSALDISREREPGADDSKQLPMSPALLQDLLGWVCLACRDQC